MKKRLKKYNLLLVLVCSIFNNPVLAVVQPPVLHKTIVKTFNLAKNDQVMIDSRYGNIEIKTWREKKVRFTVTIATQTDNIRLAKTNRVHVAASRDDHTITCRTGIDTSSALSKIQSSVNYVVYLPAGVPLTIKNKFGNITMGDYAGKLNIDEQFGDFTGGKLIMADRIGIEQGSMAIGGLRAGNITAKGFNTIKIGNVSGNVSCHFSSGNLLELHLGHKVDTLDVRADNVQFFNLRGLKNAPVKFKLQTRLVKWFNNTGLVFRVLTPITVSGFRISKDSLRLKLARKDSLRLSAPSDLLDKKKKMADITLRKISDVYEAGPDNAKGEVDIDVAFCVLNIWN